MTSVSRIGDDCNVTVIACPAQRSGANREPIAQPNRSAKPNVETSAPAIKTSELMAPPRNSDHAGDLEIDQHALE